MFLHNNEIYQALSQAVKNCMFLLTKLSVAYTYLVGYTTIEY